jgi:hypothetical protein
MPDRESRKNPSPYAQPETADTPQTVDTPQTADIPETDSERRRRRARFLRELAEARALRDRVQPRRAKTARLRRALRMRTFRW